MQDKNIENLIIIKKNLEKTLLIKQARKSFKTFCEYVFNLKPGKIHLEWHNLATKAMMEGSPCIIFAPRSHAKCHTPDTTITLADGSLKEVKDCKVGDKVISYDVENFRFVPAKIVNIIDNGIKDVYEVKLASGKSIEVTSNHPFLTADGWKSIEEGLKEKEKIAVPVYVFRMNTKKHFTDNQLKILAYLIAEGNVANHKKKVVFTNANKAIVEDLNKALREEFNLKLRKVNADNYDYYVVGNGKKFCKKEFLNFLEKYGLAGKYSYNKEIPKELFTSPEADIKLFLRCLWLCDGCICKVKRRVQLWKNSTYIEYSTSSKKLAYQIQTLLEYIGIPSIVYKGKTPKRDNFKVVIFGGKEFKLRFLKEVLDKKTEDILDYVKKAHPSTYATIPRKLVLKFLPLTPHFIRKYYGLRLDNNYDITYEKLRKLIKIFPNVLQLRLLLKAPIRWDKIVKIEYKGKKPTIGLEIEKYHNHITNGIITHNTSYMAVMRPIFLLGHNPNLRIKIVSHSDKKAADILRQIKEAIETNERLKEVFPHLEPGDVWASNKILIKRDIWSKDVTIEALGILSGATGGRADYCIFDDIVEFNNTIKYPALIPMVKEAFYNNWLNLLEPDGYGWCLIGTIWTQMDLHWEFHQKPMKYKKIYRIDLETLEPIWPEHWPKERLIERYNSMPLRAFARAFANLPISREDAVFNKETIESCIIYNDPKHYREKCDYVIIGVDLAISQKKNAANTAIFVMGVIKEKNKLVALHIEYGKWTSPETVDAITKNFEDWKADIIVVENNQYQEALIQWLNEFNRDLPVQAHFTTSAKHDPEIGLPSMALEFERKKWIIPMGKLPHESGCKCGKCKWIEELTMYPFGETSDIVMASYFAREYWRKNISSKENVEVDVL